MWREALTESMAVDLGRDLSPAELSSYMQAADLTARVEIEFPAVEDVDEAAIRQRAGGSGMREMAKKYMELSQSK